LTASEIKKFVFVFISRDNTLTSSFLLYLPVFAALAGGKEALYHPLQSPAGGKVAPAGGKVLYRPLQLLQRAENSYNRPLEQFFWCRHFFAQNSGKNFYKSKFYAVSISNV
jgi:hypothetical protein